MIRWHNLSPVGMSFFDEAPLRYRFPVELDVPPGRVWDSIASDHSVADWGLGVRSLRWTSERPFGVGATREVVLPLRAMTLREVFFRWDEGRGYSFYVREADRGVFTGFAENYEIEPRGSGSMFTWTIALDPAPRLRRVLATLGPLNKLAFGQLARSAKAYFAAEP